MPERGYASFFGEIGQGMRQTQITKIPFRNEPGRDELGGGRSPRALSRCDRLAPAKQVDPLPDAILRDLRSCRPHSRAVQSHFQHVDYWVRFICPLSQWLRPLTRRPSWGTQVIHSRPSHLTQGLPSLLAARLPVPRVSPPAPQITISLTLQRYGFCRIATASDSFSRPSSWARGYPDGGPGFCSPFGGFRPADQYGQFLATAVLTSQ